MDFIITAPGRLQLYFPPTDWDGVYDAFEVSRSRDGDAGPYEALMGCAWQPASFSIPYRSGYDVLDKHLNLLVDGRIQLDVVFTGTDPTTIMSDLNAAMPGFITSSYSTGGPILLIGSTVGLGASLSVDGDAAALLGLIPQDIHYGQDAWGRLVQEQAVYFFIDPWGRDTDFYKIRLLNRATPDGGLKYSPIPGVPRGGAGAQHLIEGHIQLFDLTGRPFVNALVTLYASQRAFPPNGMAGQMPATVTVRTDRLGRASTLLIRGARLTLSVAGTNLAREILVPQDGQSFDLLDPNVSVDNDAYKVQIPNILVGEVRSL